MKEQILARLREQDGFVSGQRMSEQLGCTRAAVWKAIRTLRDEGYAIESVTNRGYRLLDGPDRLTEAGIRLRLEGHPWQGLVQVRQAVDSTNNVCKQLAAAGAPEGTVVVADCQTGGRGRQGRQFLSPTGQGVYLSAVLRPDAPPAALTHLTAMVAVAMCDVIEEVCGVRPGIKWTNDIILNGKKICGILTELSLEAESGRVQYLVVGAGFNVHQRPEDFPEVLRRTATSLDAETGKTVCRDALAAAMTVRLCAAAREVLSGKAAWMERYRRDCITVGRDVKILRGDSVRFAHCDGVDGDGCLLVTYEDGTADTISIGEVSVRSRYGYV